MNHSKNKTVFILGGAGYIGSHTAKQMHLAGYTPVVIDNLVYGHKDFVKWGPLHQCSLGDTQSMTTLFEKYKPLGVVHLAAFTYVGESVTKPGMYYENNVCETLRLLEVMQKVGCKHFIFSSTCATYGIPETIPITEEEKQQPINPYGWSKLMAEQMIKDFGIAHGMTSVILRYFNAAGADLKGEVGENHNPESHLIPLVIDVALGRRESISVFGTDYDTPDGTCIRDYIHVDDLSRAHVLSLKHLLAGKSSTELNLGNGKGYSVKEVLSVVEKVSGKSIKVDYAPRRNGDSPILVGSSRKAKSVLGWEPQIAELEAIVQSAWNWHRSTKSDS